MTSTTTAYQKAWKLDRSRGITRLVDAAPVIAHIRHLHDEHGAPYSAISDLAGLSKSAVSYIVHNGGTVNRVTARAILILTPERLRARANPLGFVPAIGARRRIQALLAAGWRHQDIHDAASAAGTSSAIVLNQPGEWITRTTHDAYVRAYDALSGRPGPSGRTRARAAAAGYPPPAAWDDEVLDDPTALPAAGWRPGECRTPGCTSDPERRRAGYCGRCYYRRRDRRPGRTGTPARPAEHVLEDAEFLAEHGTPLGEAARRLELTPDSLERALERAGRYDVVARLKNNR